MDDKRRAADGTGALEGADAAALGMDKPPESAPPGAEVEDAEHLVPGAHFADRRPDEAKPWQTTLAYESDQAGVANDPPDAQPPNYTDEPERFEGPDESGFDTASDGGDGDETEGRDAG